MYESLHSQDAGQRNEFNNADLDLGSSRGNDVDELWTDARAVTRLALTATSIEEPTYPNESLTGRSEEQRLADDIFEDVAASSRLHADVGADMARTVIDGSFPELDSGISSVIPSQVGSFAPDFADDFSAFMDAVPNLSYTFSPTYQPLPVFFNDPDPSLQATVMAGNASVGVEQHDGPRLERPSSSLQTDSMFSRYGSRLPSLQPEDKPLAVTTNKHRLKLNDRHFLVTADYRQWLINHCVDCCGDSVDPGFTLPSRHALSRYIGSYFKNFHDHYPFFHVPTMRMGEMNAELLLAIAALGARYTREEDAGNDLYTTVRSIAMERLRKHRSTGVAEHRNRRDSTSRNGVNQFDHDSSISETDEGESQVVQLMQTLLLLIAIATWYKREPAAAEALSIRSVLHSLTQEDGAQQKQVPLAGDWRSWTRHETLKRTQLVIFCLFNIHTILFDLPPMMLASELDLDLPCSEGEWRAATEQDWHGLRNASSPEAPHQSFKEALVDLFAGNEDSNKPSQPSGAGFSALAGCALIHAVIQQIWLVRNSRIPSLKHGRRNLTSEEINTFEYALKRWAYHWERNQESSMDPLSPDGPVTFTSTALLRLAYIRLNMDLGPVRSLSSWDPDVVALSLHRSAKADRNEKLTRAALHCAHALSIPVKLGINYVAQTQLIHWSNQHALCSLECALLLAKWLQEVTTTEPSPPLTASENRVLEFVVQLVAETEYKASCQQILQQKNRLSAMTVRLWAKLYQSSSVWETVNLIGRSLQIYAELLEADGR
ncbi:putative C2H2 transcription factor [Cladophialophora carrionii]|uniref:Putative C2H2 transcription factor n=1 Tax=Cladophialophora carrionii TaxID=86049 RepID=A0A1C1CMG8_9EURO|nr:putative C2H2 transcription factor [Cladophialophora carrionii]